NNTLGGTAAGAGNLISGNSGYGIALTNTASGNLLQGNLIGTDQTGTLALPNTGAGIELDGASNNTIGGTVAGAGNLISANGGDGIQFGALVRAMPYPLLP